MARALWTGSLSFGLVNVPVQLVSAVRDLDLHFRQLHEKDTAPIETQRWCSEEEKEVPFEAITRSYELDSGKSVIVTDEDLEAVEPRATRTIDIEQFVELADVDPIYFDHPYWLVPAGDDEGAARAYSLLLGVMERTDQAALGRFVMRAKEHLAVVRARDGALTLTTMRFHDEVRSAKDVPSAGGKSSKPEKKELDAAVSLIEALAADWDPERHEDRYRKRLQKVVNKKRKGQTIEIEEDGDKQPDAVPDLMAALEQSLAEARKGRSKTKSR
ncbi:MAG: end-binding protein Ku [Thermoleophilaceae bacterium]|nr:end-binding protein Ku [Thermoleophilaceae bacterium]